MERQGDALWQQIAPFGVWLAAILILLQTLPTLDARSLWYADEVRYADALSNLVERGKWVVLELNGQAYPGVFSFYAGRDLLEYDDPVELREAVAGSETAVVVSPRKAWEDAGLEGFEQLGSYNIVVGGGEYLIMREPVP